MLQSKLIRSNSMTGTMGGMMRSSRLDVREKQDHDLYTEKLT